MNEAKIASAATAMSMGATEHEVRQELIEFGLPADVARLVTKAGCILNRPFRVGFSVKVYAKDGDVVAQWTEDVRPTEQVFGDILAWHEGKWR